MEGQEPYVPAGQNWPLLPNTVVVNDGFEIIGEAFGDVGGVEERLVADALTANIITNLLEAR